MVVADPQTRREIDEDLLALFDGLELALKGGQMGSLLLAGFGFLALQSYYYGTVASIQSTSGTMPSSSTN